LKEFYKKLSYFKGILNKKNLHLSPYHAFKTATSAATRTV